MLQTVVSCQKFQESSKMIKKKKTIIKEKKIVSKNHCVLKILEINFAAVTKNTTNSDSYCL